MARKADWVVTDYNHHKAFYASQREAEEAAKETASRSPDKSFWVLKEVAIFCAVPREPLMKRTLLS